MTPKSYHEKRGITVLIPSGLGDETVGVCAVSSFGSLPLMVDVEEDRVKVLVKGARWVSFNSVDKKEIN